MGAQRMRSDIRVPSVDRPAANRTRVPPLVLLLVFLIPVLGGCIANPDRGPDPLVSPDQGPIRLEPNTTANLLGTEFAVRPATGLPNAFSQEPSIDIATEGTVIVSGTAGTSSSPHETMTKGGYVWVSNDYGASYRLALDPSFPGPLGIGACSCDTDVVARNRTLYATTQYHWGSSPNFNANVVASTDGGQTWDTRTLRLSLIRAVHRPWLAAGPDAGLVVGYEAKQISGATAALRSEGHEYVIRRSKDGGRSWTAPVSVAEEVPLQDKTLDVLEPTTVAPSTILAPFQLGPEGSFERTPYVAVSHDGGRTFENLALGSAYPQYANWQLSLDANAQGRVVAAWAVPDAALGQTVRLHYRASSDEGRSWTPLRVAAIPGTVMQPWVSVRNDGWVAVAYYGSNMTGRLFQMPDDAPWWPRVALFGPGNMSRPQAIVNLTRDPIYRGVLCNSLVEPCADTSPMREFLSAEWTAERDLFAAFTDPRVGSCPAGCGYRVAVGRVLTNAASPSSSAVPRVPGTSRFPPEVTG